MIKYDITLTGNIFPLRIKCFLLENKKGADYLPLWVLLTWHYFVSTHTAEALGKTPTHTAQTHVLTHTGDHIKLRALGLAEPRSHSRNLPALLTGVSLPENSSQKNPPLYVWTNSFTLTKSREWLTAAVNLWGRVSLIKSPKVSRFVLIQTGRV